MILFIFTKMSSNKIQTFIVSIVLRNITMITIIGLKLTTHKFANHCVCFVVIHYFPVFNIDSNSLSVKKEVVGIVKASLKLLYSLRTLRLPHFSHSQTILRVLKLTYLDASGFQVWKKWKIEVFFIISISYTTNIR